MNNTLRLNGLIAATCTPLDEKGEVKISAIAPMVDYLLGRGVSGLYVCGSTGEGMSLSSDERIEVTKEFVETAAGRAPVIVQVGHNSLAEARRLAFAAQSAGASAISATCPSYFKIAGVQSLVDCMQEIASAAPALPFYYYHIPALTGSTIGMPQFLEVARQQIGNLTGLKYTDTKLHEFQECLDLDRKRFDVVWGCDEMLLGALATGTQAAIGSTYNIMAPIYLRLIDAVERADFETARHLQACSVSVIRVLNEYPFHSAMKAVLGMLGLGVGGCRLPLGNLPEAELATLRSKLEEIGFFDWDES